MLPTIFLYIFVLISVFVVFFASFVALWLIINAIKGFIWDNKQKTGPYPGPR